MPITPEELAKRLAIGIQARRDIRKATLELRKLGEKLIKKHNEKRKKS